MENYIVRIYRRDNADPEKMTGVFESVENETRNTFTSLRNLMDLLSLPNPGQIDTEDHEVAIAAHKPDIVKLSESIK